MARFNTPKVSAAKTKVVNLAGGKSFSESKELEFVSILLTSFIQNQFYRGENEVVTRLRELVNEVNPLFAAKASIYARDRFGMRSVTHIVAGEIAHLVKGKEWTKKYFEDVVLRPDDISEILSYYIGTYGARPIPNSLKKGLGNAFNKFNGYQLAKYKSKGKGLSLVDVVNIVHPRPTTIEVANALNALVNGKLVSTDTWESELSKAGQGVESEEEKLENKKEVWVNLVTSKKISYFALLRNLKNIFEQAPEVLPQALELLRDENRLTKSRVFPFRFWTAYNQLSSLNNRDISTTLSDVLEMSLKNVPSMGGRTLVAIDTSGSMHSVVSKYSEVKVVDLAALFGAVLFKTQNADVMTFESNATYHNVNPRDSVVTLTQQLRGHGGGTNFHAIFKTANKPYDRIIILSDMQGWVDYNTPTQDLAEYKNKYQVNPKVYSWDLAGYGTLQFPENNVYALAGFSEKVFEIMQFMETDTKVLLKEINNIEI